MAPSKKAEEVKTGELMPSGSQAIGEAIPDFIPVGDNTGSEGIGREDIQMPRIAIAQAISPQKLEGNPAFIEGLKLGEMFNTLTSDIYGKGPMEFVIVRRDPPRWVEFDEDRNMVDPSVPAGDPRTEWRVENGERKPPIATQFYDFIVWLPATGETVALSMSKTNIAAAKKLNGLIKMRIPPVPLYARRFQVETAMESNDKGTYGVFVIKTAGTQGVPNSDLIKDRAQFDMLKQIHEALKDVVVNIDREPGADDFDTAKMDAQTAASAPGM